MPSRHRLTTPMANRLPPLFGASTGDPPGPATSLAAHVGRAAKSPTAILGRAPVVVRPSRLQSVRSAAVGCAGRRDARTTSSATSRAAESRSVISLANSFELCAEKLASWQLALRLARMSSGAGNPIVNWDGAIMATGRRTWLVVGLAVVLGGPFTAYLSHQVPLWRRQVLRERRAAAIQSAIQNEPLGISVIEHGTVPGPAGSCTSTRPTKSH